ncbi:rhomboid family intramembrane serine protease [Tautonia sociabilis]|uniref:Rhomboid family intramembrane serine protease n=1 Tax=Tautonia sociabilis TaxID=2080755 RepID=A0A432MGU6_9BACT|nr:rhomboid family intramembrane serine protease [Tautonia sociabilis]RUL86127.1 rhomboid family intramembrane serine protease [Tautonia sociabilis]
MGIYDRDYIQDRPGGFGLFSGGNSAVKTLILLNVAVFALQWFTVGGSGMGIVGSPVTQAFEASGPRVLQQFQVWRLLTYAFLHADVFHILFNMWFLWMAGRELETIYGSREFLCFYLAAAVLAGVFWILTDQLFAPGASDLFQGGGRGVLGASGAVAAVLVAFALYYPRREVLLFFVLPIPMWLFVAFFVGINALGFFQQARGEETAAVAFAAHLGGAGYGYLYKVYDLRWSRLLGGVSWRRRPRLRIFSPESRPSRASRPGTTGSPSRAEGAGLTGGPSGRFADDHLDARLDEILAKIAREGRGGLTEEENRILQEASQRARNRRGERLR